MSDCCSCCSYCHPQPNNNNNCNNNNTNNNTSNNNKPRIFHINNANQPNRDSHNINNNINNDNNNDIRIILETTRIYLWEKMSEMRPAFNSFFKFFHFYCCICCHYNNNSNKTNNENETSLENDFAIKKLMKLNFSKTNANNNLLICDPIINSIDLIGTPVLHLDYLENDVNKSQTHSRKPAMVTQNTNSVQTDNDIEATPTSAKSTESYSQKSTASAKTTSNNDEGSIVAVSPENGFSTQQTPDNDALNNKSNNNNMNEKLKNGSDCAILAIEEDCRDKDKDKGTDTNKDNCAAAKEDNEASIARSASISSLQSKTESIKTQMDETPSPLSRAPSLKSVVIEEDIEIDGNSAPNKEIDSFLVVESATKDSIGTRTDTVLESPQSGLDSSPPKHSSDATSRPTTASSRKSRPPSSIRARSPSIAELRALSRRNSMIKSMESLYDRQACKHDIDNTAEETSSQSSGNHMGAGDSVIPVKVQHTPLKQKSKTSHFLRAHRRVSPVKQSIKMQQAEVFPSTMERFDKPRDALIKAFDNLDSNNWETIIVGLKLLVRLMRHHSDYLEAQMHMVCIQLTRSVRNLRSQVARSACQASTELFSLRSKTLEQECDDLICALLHRTADTNRFLRGDASRALDSMCDNVTPTKILNILTTKGASHQNGLVRTTTAKLLNRLAMRLGHDKIFAMPREYRDKFFITGANLLLEGSLDTRSYAKALFRSLSQHPSYNRLLVEVIPPRTYRNVEKSLKSIRC